MRNARQNLLPFSFAATVILCSLALPVSSDAKSFFGSDTPTATPSPVAVPGVAPAAPIVPGVTPPIAPSVKAPNIPPVAATSTPEATPTVAATHTPKPTPGPLRAKLIDVDGLSTSGISKGTIDIYMALTNKGKFDDALVNLETPIGDKASLVTVTNKKEAEAPLRVELPLEKTVKLAEGEKFIRLSGIEQSLKDGEHFQIILHFMRAPNVTVDVTVHKKASFFGL